MKMFCSSCGNNFEGEPISEEKIREALVKAGFSPDEECKVEPLCGKCVSSLENSMNKEKFDPNLFHDSVHTFSQEVDHYAKEVASQCGRFEIPFVQIFEVAFGENGSHTIAHCYVPESRKKNTPPTKIALAMMLFNNNELAERVIKIASEMGLIESYE